METRAELATRALRETLDTLLSPTLRDTLIGEALALAREGAIPDDPARFRAFLSGPLSEALERALGKELGHSVAQELEHVALRLLPQTSFVSMMPPPPRRARITTSPSGGARLAEVRNQRASTQARGMLRSAKETFDRVEQPPTEPPGNRLPSTMRPPPPSPMMLERMPTLPARGQAAWPEMRGPISGDRPAGLSWALGDAPSSSTPDSVASTARRLPLVLVSTRDPELVQRFAAWLDPRAAVLRVGRLSELLGDVDAALQRRTVIVIDCRTPLIRPQSLAGCSEELPDSVRVVLWGATPELTRVLSLISATTAKWVVCTPEMTETDVAERCVEMVG